MIDLKHLFAGAALIASAACAAPPAGAQDSASSEAPQSVVDQENRAPDTSASESMIAEEPEKTVTIAPSCDGIQVQGGIVICTGATGTEFTVGQITLKADEDGNAQFGLPQNAPPTLEWTHSSGASGTLQIAKRKDDYREITGFDCDKVDARSEAQKAHAGRSWTKKQAAFSAFHSGPGAATGFIKPTDAPTSSPFGPTRKYIGVSKVTGEPCDKVSVHRGYDMAAPIGTPVIAPAAGTVILGDPDLYYEGGTVFLDHGNGLVSVFMHLSEVDVGAGDTVQRGDVLAKTGNSGRTTGPHLHWAVKWRNPEAEDRRGDFYIDPALLLTLPVTP